MSFQRMIAKKRDGHSLSRDEIESFIKDYTNGRIPDYQVSALLMAVYFRGMNIGETRALTGAMMNSGDVLDLSAIEGMKIDKHSTGGVGDKLSLMIAPMAAACGLKVPMVSGRGLGHTGGTLDKLESIPGYKTDLSEKKFIDIINSCGASIIGQTAQIAPADKKIYALRDVTATVESIPLITASILSKKLASGTDGIVFDIKCGNGAFMKTISDAQELARSLVETAREFGKQCRAVITSMDQPLGFAAGNSLEVIEAIKYLKGKRPADADDVIIALGSNMLIIGGAAGDDKEARGKLEESISSGRALEIFAKMVELHGGDAHVIDDYSLLPMADSAGEFKASSDGFLAEFDTMEIGLSANMLGAGRSKVEDSVDHGVGFIFRKKLGDYLKEGDVIAEVYARSEESANNAISALSKAITIQPEESILAPRVIKVIS
ncbi:MAG: thymidine phosphorylase [candidate division Zixibacteria bacterium]|nr:thymidine phosphorylase [candidate division Zixibacteria bacterium]